MAELPVVTPRKLIRALEQAGFYVHHVKGGHYYLKHPNNPTARVSVSYHPGDVKRGTLRSILKQAGMTVEELVALL
jgi:predicted RNA binding protein YcfA (HicA-like mRNA interferase family)